MLLARGSRLPLEDGLGYVIVFDDITQVISAQRAVAWGEVARRLAHEIKNPLTPIQLAAERLQMKLVDKLPGGDADVLKRGTSTIVNQVAAMKRMVDDFRDYARVPPARLVPLDLNALIEEVVTLYRTAGAPVLAVAGVESAADRGRRHAAAPGHPQSDRQCAGSAGRPGRCAHHRAHRTGRVGGESSPVSARFVSPSRTTGRASRRIYCDVHSSLTSPPSRAARGSDWPWSRKSSTNTEPTSRPSIAAGGSGVGHAAALP